MWRIGVIGVSILIGLAILGYHGPMVEVIRGNGGDVIAVFTLALTVGYWGRRSWFGALGAFGVAVVLECLQVILQTNGSSRDLFIGAVFDGWDFLAYGIGAFGAWIFERMIRREA